MPRFWKAVISLGFSALGKGANCAGRAGRVRHAVRLLLKSGSDLSLSMICAVFIGDGYRVSGIGYRVWGIGCTINGKY